MTDHGRATERDLNELARDLTKQQMVRKVWVGWWVKNEGWCPTRNILEFTLRRMGR